MASAVPPVPLNNAKGMSEVARLALMHASALEQRDAGIINEMASKWVHIQKGLEGQVNKVAQEIAALQAQGKPVTQAWLNELSYYKQLEEQAKNAALGYVNWAQTYTQHQMLQTMAIGMDNATGMLNAGRTKAMDYFRGLPKTQVEAIQSLLMADAPLDKLFNSIIPGGSNLIGNALMQGLSWGMPNKEIAKLMSNAAAIPYNRSLLIARTEINRAYRDSTLYTYQKYGVVGKYKRMCSRRHACMACQLLDGTVYPANIPLSDHPNGACTMVPWVNGMKEPMWETGTERFNNMPEEGQREMMGNNYYDAWKRGDFQLKDMVQMHHSPTWGDSPGLVPLGKLSPNWKSYAAGKAQQPAAAVTQAANLFANPLSLKDRQYYKDLFEDLRFEGTGMAERQLKQNAAAIMNLSDSDKKAFRNYTGSGYHDMNAALRKGATMNWSDLKLDNELSDIFPNLPPTQGAFVTRRGCGDWSPTAVVGDRIVDPAYMSTSISMPFGGNKFEIVVPAGSKNVAYIPKISIFDNEKELLFNKNGIFEVLDIIHESDGYNTYRLLYIGNLGD